MTNAELATLQSMKSNSRWLDAHFEELLKDYEGRYIAVKSQKIVDTDRDFEKLLQKVQKHGIDAGETLIYFMTKSRMILGTA